MAEIVVPTKYSSLFFPAGQPGGNLVPDSVCLTELQAKVRGKNSAAALLAQVYKSILATLDPDSFAGTSPEINFSEVGDDGEAMTMLVLAALMGKATEAPKPSLIQLMELAEQLAPEISEDNGAEADQSTTSQVNSDTTLVIQFIQQAAKLPTDKP